MFRSTLEVGAEISRRSTAAARRGGWRAVVVAVALGVVAPVLGADNWPGWRGPAGDGVSTEKDLPVHWSKDKNVRWKVVLEGAGVSCPVVWGDRVFLTASTGRRNDQLHVYGYRRADGHQLWHTRLFGTAPTDLYPPGGMAVPTPAADGKHLYVLFGTGDLACLDLAGRPVWLRSLAQEYGPFRNRWGMGASPVLVGDLLIIQVDHWSQSYLLGIDAGSGANRWKTDRDTSVNWSSPLPVTVAGQKQLVVVGTEKARAYEAATGRELWSVGGLHFQCIPTPVALGRQVFVTSGVGSLALRLEGDSQPQRLWVSKRTPAFVPSPVAYQGCLYVPGDQGFVTCLEAESGRKLWKERMGQQYHASPVAGDGKVYFPSREGVVRVVHAGPAFQLLAANDLGEAIVASPAISGGAIFLRGEKHLFCIGPGPRP
jgi:outer membrane protein assembly factor BamB